MTVKTEVTRSFYWEAAHRIENHSGKCKAFHGHGYRADVTVGGSIDDLGMIIDFAELDGSIGAWIGAHLDHTAILDKADKHPAAEALRVANRQLGRPVLETDGPPTAE